jgi:hypothetical protein
MYHLECFTEWIWPWWSIQSVRWKLFQTQSGSTLRDTAGKIP